MTMSKYTLSLAIILLLFIGCISCNDDDACPNDDGFWKEFQSIENCSIENDSNLLKAAVLGTWNWNYEYGGWTGLDCERLSGTSLTFESDGHLVVDGDRNANSTWEIISFSSGKFGIWTNPNSKLYAERAFVCGNKLALSSPGWADSDTHILSK